MAKKKGKKIEKDYINVPIDHLVVYADHVTVVPIRDRYNLLIAQNKVVGVELEDRYPTTYDLQTSPTMEIALSYETAKSVHNDLEHFLKQKEETDKKKGKRKGKKKK